MHFSSDEHDTAPLYSVSEIRCSVVRVPRP